jgi:hypothetical protein
VWWQLGCGNSLVSEELYVDGHTNIVNCDISATCIEMMAARCAEHIGMTWVVEDAAALSFGVESFDVVFDKGTVDALSTTSAGRKIIHDMIVEVNTPSLPCLCAEFDALGASSPQA